VQSSKVSAAAAPSLTRAAKMHGPVSSSHSTSASVSTAALEHPPAASAAASALAQIRDLMWRQVGIMRTGKELSAAIELLEKMQLPRSQHAGRREYELSNLHCLASLMARSALAREESRGSHYRSDFPYRDDDLFQKHSLIQRSKDVAFEP